MRDKGFYYAFEINEDEIGFSITCSFHKQEKDLQFSILILDMAFAIGWTF